MTTNRENRRHREAAQRAKRTDDTQATLDRRRADMHTAEGHSGSIPRGNQHPEDENLGHRRLEYERILGH
jgi:hypothetical protein